MSTQQNSTTGLDIQLLSVFAEILELAVSEPGTLDEANETLHAIEGKAAQVSFDRQA